MRAPIDNPILNGPYDPPGRHFELSSTGPTGAVIESRRESESFIPVPPPKKGQKNQQSFDLDVSGERRQKNDLINEIRYQVGLWRGRGYPNVTPISRKLLVHWADDKRENRVMFCQREAVETAIFLTEAAHRQGGPDFKARIDAENARHNSGLPRLALKMATGSGKTVVMAMLIAWQTINKSFTARDARFSNRFLVVTPGITIRDRLRVILPSDEGNYYRQRDLVPADLWAPLLEAQIVITNYHAFLPRTVKEMKGVSSTTKKILRHGQRGADPFVESDDQIVSRVLRDLSGRGKGEVVVLNDEAHHCYRDRPIEEADADVEEGDKDDKSRNEDARVWFRGLVAVNKKVGIKSVFDLSATPYYLKGSGYNEGFIFPWTVSDFSLMDAIESGIVKVPKVPVDDNATNTLVTYLRLWDHVGTKLPKRKNSKAASNAEWVPPDTLEGAMRSLYQSYAQSFEKWERDLAPRGEPPPVMIVVCPNTVVSKLVFDWIAGQDVEQLDNDANVIDTHARPGHLSLLSNVVDGKWLDRPRTVLIDSAQLESGEAMKQDFKDIASREIEQFKDDIRRRSPGADVDNLTDEDLLREVMNTVGKKGRLGEQIRCVVSVSMLTEGWDANTVSHILGIRAFRSQLLCEQVVGRGLRRRSYELNDDGMFDAEYAEVYGVPFAFIPTDRQIIDPKPRPAALEVHSVPDRSHLRITFPRLTGYRIELTPEPLMAGFGDDSKLHVDRTTVATVTETGGVVGEQGEHRLDDRPVREQEVAYELAKYVVNTLDLSHDDVPVHTRFPQVVQIAKDWLASCLTFEPGCDLAMLLQFAELRAKAAERIHNSIVTQRDDDGNLIRSDVLQPVFRSHDHVGSTDDVSFFTRKLVYDTTKSPINRVTLDGQHGNSWEEAIAIELENDSRVLSYVKNDHLEFAIPYVHAGLTHDYHTDFLVRLAPIGDDDTIERTLIVEVSGGRKDQAVRKVKAETTREQWCPAVNNHGGFGIWDFVEIDDMTHAVSKLDAAIERLLADPLTRALAD
jgi:type III restriction enzyme